MNKVKIRSVAIVGGTGTLGKALTKTITESWRDTHVTVISRCEHKQAEMKRIYPNLDFAIADVRDYDSIAPYLSGRDLVLHVAAMKHVDLIEKNPAEAIKTNVLGTMNVARACISGKVPYVCYSSTDKAVDPINTYGFTKALGEKYLFDLNKKQNISRFSVYRWGNIVGSQGSVIPQFIHTLKTERMAYITDVRMTRFWLPIEWPVRYMLRTFSDAYKDKAMVPPNMKAANITDVVAALAQLLDIHDYTLVDIGHRPGEKLHEAMYSAHEAQSLTSFDAETYTIEELKELLRPFVQLNQQRIAA